MRIAWPILALALGACMFGRATASKSAEASINNRIVTGRVGDVFRIPAIRLVCGISVELRDTEMVCSRTTNKPRYRFVFFRHVTFVYGPRGPENPMAFSEP